MTIDFTKCKGNVCFLCRYTSGVFTRDDEGGISPLFNFFLAYITSLTCTSIKD